MPPCKDLSPLAGFVKIMLHFLPLDFSLCISKTFNFFFHSKHGPHQSPSEQKPFFTSLHQVLRPLCTACLTGRDLFTNISTQNFCSSKHALRCACTVSLRGGDFFLKNVQRARSCARCASLGETAPAKRLLVVHAKSTTVVVRPTGGRWHYPANHLQPSHLHQH